MRGMVWFGIAGYPEIKAVKREMCADTRPGHFVGYAVCASVTVGDWSGVVNYSPGHELAENVGAVIASAKRCVDYQREKRSRG